jgi:hypothetical protein
MISPEEIVERARKLWASGRPLRASLGAEPLFPYVLPFRKPSASEWLEHFAELRNATERIDASSKERVGAGYRVDYREIAHQKLGRLRIPERIVFDNVEDVAACAKQTRILDRFRFIADTFRAFEPRLLGWLADYPLRAIEHEAAIARLLELVTYFEAHPRPMRFARELGIPGIDSKFIEAHQSLLTEWLDRVLPDAATDATVRGLSDHGFERRYGLRYEEPLISFRWLDPLQALAGCITDVSLPVSQFSAYAPPCSRVFITENKINFLTLPASDNAIGIFGGGYGIDRLGRIHWLRDMEIHYWGDIDTHGFAILSRLRAQLPHARSFLMDRDTLLQHREFWSEEPADGRCTRDLECLTDAERELYDDLRNDRLTTCLRLEQERIAYRCIEQAMELVSATPRA